MAATKSPRANKAPASAQKGVAGDLVHLPTGKAHQSTPASPATKASATATLTASSGPADDEEPFLTPAKVAALGGGILGGGLVLVGVAAALPVVSVVGIAAAASG